MEYSSQVCLTFYSDIWVTSDIWIFQYNMGDSVGAPVNEETVGHLRQRLNVMRDIVKVRIRDIFGHFS